MKKIWIVLWNDPRKNIWWVNKVINEIFSHYDENHYELFYYFISDFNFIERENNRIYCGIKSFWFSILKMFPYWGKLRKYLLNQKIDLVVDNTLWVWLFHKLPGSTKLIQICHWLPYWWLKNVYVKGFIRKFWYLFYYWSLHKILKRTSKLAECVVCMDIDAISGLNRYYWVPKKKIVNIYNWVDYVEDKNFIREKVKGDGLKVVFIWNNYPWKRLDILEEVAKKLKNQNVEFYVIWPNYIPKYCNIKYLWYLSWDEKEKHIRMFDIVFMPSNFEGQNLVVSEGMALWLIPMASYNTHVDVARWTELEKFISKDNDVEFYVNKINRLLKNVEQVYKLKVLSINSISPYLWNIQKEKYWEIIVNILK